MAWRRTGASHYLNQWWHGFLTHICVIWPYIPLLCIHTGPALVLWWNCVKYQACMSEIVSSALFFPWKSSKLVTFCKPLPGTPNSDKYVSQQWLRKWPVAWRQHAVKWSNVDSRFFGITGQFHRKSQDKYMFKIFLHMRGDDLSWTWE